MIKRYPRPRALLLAAALLPVSIPAMAAEQGRQLEQIVVTAERRESTVQDTSISMSAFDANFIDNFNIRNPEDLQNYMPATVIQTYDASIRGVGRTFRTLGGDPGIATYLNDVYSEDFAIAATEGGLQDLARVEVLRGPQGTLYGRNAVGGAVNFITKRPTEQFEVDVEASAGNFGLFEHSAAFSGPIIEDYLRARLTTFTRDRDGFLDDTSPFESAIASQGDSNIALSFESTPMQNLTIFLRANHRNTDQKFNGGAGAMPLFAGDLGPDGYQDGFRNTSTFAFGFREVTPGQNNPALPGYMDPDANTFEFQHPVSGSTVLAQRVRPGIDPASGLNEPLDADGDGQQDIDPNTGLPAFTQGNATSSALLPNYAFGHPEDRVHAIDRENMDGDDLLVDTNGNVAESFDHDATQFNIEYTGGNWEAKYIFGYTDFTYQRNTDEDFTGGVRFGTDEFFVEQENENIQHEVRLTFDTGPVTTTTGAFFYESQVNQRLDLYDPIDTQGRLQDTASYDGFGMGSDEANAGVFGQLLQTLDAIGSLGPDTTAVNEPLNDIREAQRLATIGQVELAEDTGAATVLAPWYGDSPPPGETPSRLANAKPTLGTHFAWENDIETDAFAAYFQSEWRINEKWSFTGGLRYSKDEKTAIERLIGQQENVGLTPLAVFDAFDLNGNGVTAELLPGAAAAVGADPSIAVGCGLADGAPNMLCLYNAVNGAIDPTNPIEQPGDLGTNPGDEPVRLTGVPIAFNIYRPLETEDSEVTWRANLDYRPDNNSLIYGSVTTGWKAGGFNLGYFSTSSAVYDEETIISYELGYKTQMLNNTLQLNSAVYYYEQEDRQTGTRQVGGLGTSTDIINWPEQEAFGWEGDVMWLATDALTIGGNWSYTKSEFASDFPVVDTLNPETPVSLFTSSELTVTEGDGRQQPKIPEWKATGWMQYTWRGNTGNYDLFSSVAYTGEWWIEPPFQRDLDRAPEFIRWDIRGTWTSHDETWEVSAFINNVTDEVGVRDIERETGSLNYQRTITTTEPRLYGVGLRYRFTSL